MAVGPRPRIDEPVFFGAVPLGPGDFSGHAAFFPEIPSPSGIESIGDGQIPLEELRRRLLAFREQSDWPAARHRLGVEMDEVTRTERFVQALTGCQSRLFAFILTLIPDVEKAQDILQETNLAIWRKADEFCEGTNFGSWACRIAHFRVLAYWRDTGRDRHVFDQEFLQDLAAASIAATADIDARRAALRQCLAELEVTQRQLLQLRYSSGSTVASLAKTLGILPGTISNRLYRLRQILRNCIRKKLAVEGT